MSTIIGLVSTFRLPLQGRRVKVQKGRVSLTIWTLERCDAQRKSKRGAEACRIVLYKILVNKYSACYNMQAYFVYTVKTKRLKCRNTQSGRNLRCYL